MSFSLKSNIIFDSSNQSAFGTLETDELTPVMQIDFVHGINTQTGVSTIVNSATVDANSSRLRLQSGANSAGSAIFNSRKIAKYRPGQGMTARFTGAFGTGTTNNTQICGVGSSTDGVFFGYNGTSFGILHRNNSVDTWVAQASWNGLDKADGSGASQFNWNKQNGNVMMIKYPFLGYGDIQFFVQDSTSGKWVNVHTIRYANTSASTEFLNPNMYFYVQNVNSGNTSNITMYVGSASIFVSGVRSYVYAPRWATDTTKSTVSTEAALLSIRNATTYNGIANRSIIKLNTISFSSSSNTNAILRLKLGATLGGTPTYTPINGSTADNGVTITSGNSIASVDTAGTTVTGGIYIYSTGVGANGTAIVDLSQLELYIAPGETLTFSGFGTANTNMGLTVTWHDEI